MERRRERKSALDNVEIGAEDEGERYFEERVDSRTLEYPADWVTGRWLKRSEIVVDDGRARERVGGREVPDMVVMRTLRRDMITVVPFVLAVLWLFWCTSVRIATFAGDGMYRRCCSRVASI